MGMFFGMSGVNLEKWKLHNLSDKVKEPPPQMGMTEQFLLFIFSEHCTNAESCNDVRGAFTAAGSRISKSAKS